MKCPGCGAQAHKGTTVLLLEANTGSARRARVCRLCLRRAVKVVAQLIPPVVDTAKSERADQRAVLEPFVRLFKGQLAGMKRAPIAKMDEHTRETQDGRIEQLEAVIAALEEGRA